MPYAEKIDAQAILEELRLSDLGGAGRGHGPLEVDMDSLDRLGICIQGGVQHFSAAGTEHPLAGFDQGRSHLVNLSFRLLVGHQVAEFDLYKRNIPAELSQPLPHRGTGQPALT